VDTGWAYTHTGDGSSLSGRAFDWDMHNVGHLGRHGIEPFEVEEVVLGIHLIARGRDVGGEERWKLLRQAMSGRYLVVVFTLRNQLIRPVTACEMKSRDKRLYVEQIANQGT
jgi:uncharacterized DUF497 family protein